MSSEQDFDRSIATRRSVLAGTGTLATLAMAGCLGDDDETDETGSGTDGDEQAPDQEGNGEADANGDTDGEQEETVRVLAERVGDVHGHDYEHDGLTVEEIEHACGHLEFDDGIPITSTATQDDAPIIDSTHDPFEVTVTDGRGYVAFELETEDHDTEISTFNIIDRDTDDVVADLHGDHWHGELPHIHEGEHISLGATIEDDHGDEIELDGDQYELRVDHAHDHDADIVSFDFHGDHVHIISEEAGDTEVVFQLYHDDHVEFETPAIAVEVEHDDHDEHGHEDEHDYEDGEIGTFEIIDRDTDEVAAWVHDDHWDGSLPHIHEGEHISLGATIEDDHGDEIELDGDQYELRVDHAHDHDADIVSFDFHGDHVHIIGEEAGDAEVVFQLYHDDHVEFETPAIAVEVEHDAHDEHGHEDEHDHDHAGELFGLFFQDGSLDVVTGDLVYEETSEVTECDQMDRYLVVEADHGEILVEVTT